MMAALVVAQFVVIILMSVGWWRDRLESEVLRKQLGDVQGEVLERTSEMRMLEEENRIIINEIVSAIDTRERVKDV